jgi:hypothetical protein
VTRKREREDRAIARLEGAVQQLARALKRAAEEHSRPNSFYLQELHTSYGAPPPLVQARISRENWLWNQLRGALGALGGAPWGYLGFRGPKKGGQAWEV